MDVLYSRVNSKFYTVPNGNSYRPQYNDQRRATFDSRNTDQRRTNFDSRNTSDFQRDTRRKQPQSIKKCDACRPVGEPFIGHSTYNSRNIASNGRASMIKSFALEVDSDNTQEMFEDIPTMFKRYL